jgi:hypothetical protein
MISGATKAAVMHLVFSLSLGVFLEKPKSERRVVNCSRHFHSRFRRRFSGVSSQEGGERRAFVVSRYVYSNGKKIT